MKTPVRRWSTRGLMLLLFAAVAGCVVGGGYGDGGYAGDVGVGYGVGFYEPGGYDYGGWGPGYGVGPPRPGFDRGRPDVGRGRPDSHAAPHPSYRPAPPSRSVPSVPTHPRGR